MVCPALLIRYPASDQSKTSSGIRCGRATKEPEGLHGGESGLNIFASDAVKLRIEPTPGLPSAFAHSRAVAKAELDLLDCRERLKRLHDSGAIDDDPFRRMRDRLVAEAGWPASPDNP